MRVKRNHGEIAILAHATEISVINVVYFNDTPTTISIPTREINSILPKANPEFMGYCEVRTCGVGYSRRYVVKGELDDLVRAWRESSRRELKNQTGKACGCTGGDVKVRAVSIETIATIWRGEQTAIFIDIDESSVIGGCGRFTAITNGNHGTYTRYTVTDTLDSIDSAVNTEKRRKA